MHSYKPIPPLRTSSRTQTRKHYSSNFMPGREEWMLRLARRSTPRRAKSQIMPPGPHLMLSNFDTRPVDRSLQGGHAPSKAQWLTNAAATQTAAGEQARRLPGGIHSLQLHPRTLEALQPSTVRPVDFPMDSRLSDNGGGLEDQPARRSSAYQLHLTAIPRQTLEM